MNITQRIAPLSLALALAAWAPSALADSPASGTSDEPTYMMMNHSPGDSKAMRTMKDHNIPLHHAGDPIPASNAPAQNYIMMNHSPGDSKAMRTMKDRHVPIQRNTDTPTDTRASNQ